MGNTSKSLAAMQAVSQASSDKLSQVEHELRATKEGQVKWATGDGRARKLVSSHVFFQKQKG